MSYNLLTRMICSINNAAMAKKQSVSVKFNKLCLGVAGVLKDEGYIADFKKVNISPGIDELVVDLKYKGSAPVIKLLRAISKPSRTMTTRIKNLRPTKDGLGTLILSTNKGVLSDKDAQGMHVGGVELVEVF